MVSETTNAFVELVFLPDARLWIVQYFEAFEDGEEEEEEEDSKEMKLDKNAEEVIDFNGDDDDVVDALVVYENMKDVDDEENMKDVWKRYERCE